MLQQPTDKCFSRKWFCDIVRDAQTQNLLHDVATGLGCHDDEPGVGKTQFGFPFFEKLDAIHCRHPQVEHDQIRHFAQAAIQPRHAIAGQMEFNLVGFQLPGHQALNQLTVINAEQFWCRIH